jgi:LCP family protein required for cell wall assembly
MNFGTRRRARRRNIHHASTGRRWPKRLLIGVLIVVVLAVVGGIGGWFYVNSVLGSIKRVQVSTLTPQASGAPIDILLVGSDSRAFVDGTGQASAFGNSATQTGQRSDVIVVVRLVPGTRQIEMLSIPRDTYVPIPGTGGSNRVNAAFNTGPSLLVKTIEDDFGIPINHVMLANFPGFEGMVNALGGISLDFRYPVRDQYSGLNVTTLGCQTVNGTQALALVRSRHLYYYKDGAWNYDGMSDWSRIQRQQAFFHAVLNKVSGEFPNVLAMNSFLRATAGDLKVDSGLSSGEMMSLGLKFRGVNSNSLATEVLPTSGTVIGGNDVLLAAQPYSNQMISKFLAFGTTTSTTGTSSSTKASAGTVVIGPGIAALASDETTPTTPRSQVVFDNPKNLPEPWNPTPC